MEGVAVPETHGYKPEATEPGEPNAWHECDGQEVDNANQEDFEHEGNSRRYIDSPEETIDSPLDLRTFRLPNVIEHRRPVIFTKKNIKEIISVAEFLENFYYDETFINQNPPKLESSSYEETQEHYVVTDYSIHQKRYSEMKYEYCETECNIQDYWSVAANTDSERVESSTQTLTTETKDASAQTDLRLELLTYPMVKNLEKVDVKLTCSICRRLYASKNSFDRHLKTHVEINNNQQVKSNVRFTTETKLQFYKKQSARKRRIQPITNKQPSNNKHQCSYCKQFFNTQKERDVHFEDCIIEPFVMTKCPECSIKFYTADCLNEHVELVHKKHNSTNAYYCIFCNENFDAAFTFQLHLEKHLSP